MSHGTLYVIATPIGNLEDITFRAIRILKEIDIVFCEDTRQTRKLLNAYGISVPTRSLHMHSSDQKINGIIDMLVNGTSIAYVTDSGTPALSDPGSKLVATARERNIPICPIPGPSALAALVSVSGYHGKNIIFTGFLAKKESKRNKELQRLKEFDGLIVIYESPYRIKKLLQAIHEIFKDTRILIGREMTKIHEEFIYGSIDQIINTIDHITEKGEFTIAIVNSDKDKKYEKNVDKIYYGHL